MTTTLPVRAAVLAIGVGMAINASQIMLDFEGFPDSTILTDQYPSVTFSNALILTAGITLNEFEFPPHSGENLVSDNGGAVTISFATPIASFTGYFTYAEPLIIQAFGVSNSQVAFATSLFKTNEGLSGDVGSSPNEFLQVLFTGGISSVIITGDPSGVSFTLDDARITTNVDTPEPTSLDLALIGIAVIVSYFMFAHRLYPPKNTS